MFMKYLLLSLLVFSITATTMAADAKKKVAQASASKTMTELGKIDEKTLNVAPESKTKEVTDETALYAKPSAVKVNFSCKAKDGHEIKQGEQGYDECLQKVKNDKNNPHAPNAEIKVNTGN